MTIALRIIFGLVTFICFAGGANLLMKGATSYLPPDAATIPRLDNVFRFVSAIYFSLGFLLIYVNITITRHDALLYFIGLIILSSGLGRALSYSQVGSAGAYFDFIMIFEIVLGLTVILLQYFRK